MKTYEISITGIVQGVGFRPFIFNLAGNLKIDGAVFNTTRGVIIKFNSPDSNTVKKFISDIRLKKPPASVIEEITAEEIPFEKFKDFKIKKSKKEDEKFQLISPDIATCSLCLRDINNKKDSRRYYYSFTNCTNCGPRFTIIKKMPYDRTSTTMNKFLMCKDCYREYNNPSDRRFHAQPNACRKCGPVLSLIDKNGKDTGSKNPVISASELLFKGKIIAIKSLGGFQIACSAFSDETITRLRKSKNRPSKPFAVMIKDIKTAKRYYHLSKIEIESLTSSRAPIVLIKKKKDNYPLSRQVSMYNIYEGVMLPYTPIHHLLFNHINIPLIMTSGNISEEPIAAENNEALNKLKNICDYFLIHNRDIYSRYDDSVLKIFNKKEMIIRRARGYSPYPVKLKNGAGGKTIFAAGAHEKNTFCFLIKNNAIISQHIGDLDDMESLNFYNSTFRHYRNIFNIDRIDLNSCDKHPLYASTKFIKSITPDINNLRVQHHKAHIASVIAENNINDNIIGFAWDGTGYGDDGKIWGSETFYVDKNLNFTRIGHLAEKFLPGGEVSIKKPYRMAITYLYYLWKEDKTGPLKIKETEKKNFPQFIYDSFPFYKKLISPAEIDAIINQIETGFNSPLTTSMGRFFDAVSSILNCTHISTYEGEAAVHLEMIADSKIKSGYPGKFINFISDNTYVINDHYIFYRVFRDMTNNVPKNIISSRVHHTLAEIVLKLSLEGRKTYNANKVALSGGVFQNNYLMGICFDILKKNNFQVYSNFKVPVNDGGISLGQACIASRIFTV